MRLVTTMSRDMHHEGPAVASSGNNLLPITDLSRLKLTSD